MAEKIYLETTELENIASSLKTKGNSINDEFTNSCYAALEMCSKCLEITGLDTNQFFESFKSIYSNISIRCGNLSKFISETIIPSYNEVTNAITKNFNTELGDKIASIIGIGGASAAFGVTSAPEANSIVKQGNEATEKINDENVEKVEKVEKEPKVTESEKDNITKDNNYEHSNKNVNTETDGIEENNLEQNAEENIPQQIQEEVFDEPIIETEPEIMEEQPVLGKSEALLASDMKGGTIKKGVGVGLGLAGAAAAAGTTGYIINSNKEKENESNEKRELIDAKKFLEKENVIL